MTKKKSYGQELSDGLEMKVEGDGGWCMKETDERKVVEIIWLK